MNAVANLHPATGTQTAARKYLTFVLGDTEYAVPVHKVREIIKAMEITSVPQVAPYVKGVINLRGKVIPVVDLRLKFGLDRTEHTDRTCIVVVDIVIRSATVLVGVVVDSVSDVVAISADDIEAAPELADRDPSACVEALAKVKGAVKIIVNLDGLFVAGEIDAGAPAPGTPR